MQLNVPILAVIGGMTLLSVGGAISGGLVMYFEGLESLEKSVSETSKGEADTLRNELLQVINSATGYASADMRFLSSRVLTGNDPLAWSDILRALFFAQVKYSDTLYYIGLKTYVYGQANTSVFYTDVFRNGDGFAYSIYGPHLPNTSYTVSNGAVTYLGSDSYALDQGGNPTTFLYSWDASFDVAAHPTEVFDPAAGVVASSTDYVENIAVMKDAVGSLWSPPWQFPDASGRLVAYMYLSAAFVPPPPPHPWSSERAVIVNVGLLFSSFAPAFTKYKALRADTDVVFIDRDTRRVFASTAGIPMVPDWCQPGAVGANVDASLQLGSCYLTADRLPRAMSDAVAVAQELPYGAFARRTAGGTEHFILRSMVFNAGSAGVWELVWLRPVSSVDGDVQQALVLLAVFAASVLVVSVGVALIQVWYVALPLRCLADAILHIGNMETTQAAVELSRHVGKCVLVSEVRSIMCDMVRTVGRLDEYRTYMPVAVLGGGEEDGSTTETHISGSSTKSKRTNIERSRRSAGSDRVAVSSTVLGLGLTRRRVALLVVNAVRWQAEKYNNDALVAMHSALVTDVLAVCATHYGALESLSGDRFLLGWNASRSSTDIFPRSVRCAMALSEGGVKLSSAAMSGTARVGNMGNSVMRRFMIITPLMRCVYELEQFNKATSGQCTIDETMFDAVSTKFEIEVVDAMILHLERPLAVAHIHKELQVQTDEWMYQLEAAEALSKYSNQNRKALAVLRDEPVDEEEKWPDYLAHFGEGRGSKFPAQHCALHRKWPAACAASSKSKELEL